MIATNSPRRIARLASLTSVAVTSPTSCAGQVFGFDDDVAAEVGSGLRARSLRPAQDVDRLHARPLAGREQSGE